MSISLRFFIDSPPLTQIHACVLHVKLTIEIDDGYIDKTQDNQIFRQTKHYEYFFPCTNPHKKKSCCNKSPPCCEARVTFR